MDLNCPNQPNCVSSQASQPKYLVAPLVYSGIAADALRRLADIVRTMPGGKVTSIDQSRLCATFTSRLFGFVDDVDFAVRDDELIDVRSKSRSGCYDFGVNRSRVEKIRELFEPVR